MIPKNKRATKKMFAEPRLGKLFSSENFSLRVTPLESGPRFSFVVSKKNAKSATTRNKIRRRGYESLRAHIKKINAKKLFIFYCKKGAQQISFERYSKEVSDLLSKSTTIH